MFNLSRFASLGHVVRNFGASRKLFASTSVLAEKPDAIEVQKQELAKKMKSKKMNPPNCAMNYVRIVYF